MPLNFLSIIFVSKDADIFCNKLSKPNIFFKSYLLFLNSNPNSKSPSLFPFFRSIILSKIKLFLVSNAFNYSFIWIFEYLDKYLCVFPTLIALI